MVSKCNQESCKLLICALCIVRKSRKMDVRSDLIYNYEFCEGLRVRSQLLYIPDIKQLYKFKGNCKLSKRYVCYNKACSASAVIDLHNENLVRIPKSSAAHNHTDNESLKNKMKTINEIKKQCGNVSIKRSGIREVFNEVCSRDCENPPQVNF